MTDEQDQALAALRLEVSIAEEAEQRGADQLRAVQDLLDKAMTAGDPASVSRCASLAKTALALHERLAARVEQLKTRHAAAVKRGEAQAEAGGSHRDFVTASLAAIRAAE